MTRDGFDWLEHNTEGKPICAYCGTLLEYKDMGKFGIVYDECLCQIKGGNNDTV